MATQASAGFTIKEAAHLAGVVARRIEKDCEEGTVPRRKTKFWMRETLAAHAPMHAVAYRQIRKLPFLDPGLVQRIGPATH